MKKCRLVGTDRRDSKKWQKWVNVCPESILYSSITIYPPLCLLISYCCPIFIIVIVWFLITFIKLHYKTVSISITFLLLSPTVLLLIMARYSNKSHLEASLYSYLKPWDWGNNLDKLDKEYRQEKTQTPICQSRGRKKNQRTAQGWPTMKKKIDQESIWCQK